MEKSARDRLIEILSVPIYPRIGADPAEVVADYLLDNDVRPVVHAHWETAQFQNMIWTATCSHCGNYSTVEHDFKGRPMYYKRCPNCGAKMDEEVEENVEASE